MTRWLQPLGLAALVALVGYAGFRLLVDSDADEAVEDLITDAQSIEQEQEIVERARDHRRKVARRLAMTPESARDGDDPSGRVGIAAGVGQTDVSSADYGSGQVDPSNAREGFSATMDRVEALAKSRRRLTQEEWDALYREANDAFAALSMMIDGHDDAQLVELEAAHLRLKQGLRKVRVRGQKLAD